MSLIAEVSLSYKSPVPLSTSPRITSPTEAYNYLKEIWNPDTLELREEFVIILLDNAKHVLGWSNISQGSSTATIVDIASIFQVALLGKANSIILAHNHPSSNQTPSCSDLSLTKKAVEAGKLLGIAVDDHIIIYQDGFTSFSIRGLI